MLYCDLDGFKAVNDRFGHDTGDELLIAVADRLRQSLRARDLLARLGGDEFAVVVTHNNVTQSEDIAARLLESLQTPFLISGNVTRIQASIGIAHSGDDRNASDLMREADMAMYRAKGMGKNRIVVFEPSLRSETLYRLEMEDELRQALANGHIQLNFQPLVDLVSGKVLGFEALARWQHETLGQVSPAVFVPLAEQTGLMSQLGSQVMELVHTAAADLQAASESPLSLSVNVSPLEVCEPRLLSQVRRFVEDYPNIDLVIELTESVLLGDDIATSSALEAVAADRRPAGGRRLRRGLLLDRLPAALPGPPGQDRQVLRPDGRGPAHPQAGPGRRGHVPRDGPDGRRRGHRERRQRRHDARPRLPGRPGLQPGPPAAAGRRGRHGGSRAASARSASASCPASDRH